VSDLLVITFQKETDAADALARIKSVQHSGGLNLSDVAIVTKDASGKVNVENHADSATKAGAVGGGALGLLIGLFFFPVLGIVIGAGIGALIGKSLHHNVDPGIVRDVTTDLTPGTSAIFILVDGSAAALAGAVEPFRGKVYQTSLDPELEAQIKDELSHDSPAS
jgi:uncharacterized membrane protein